MTQNAEAGTITFEDDGIGLSPTMPNCILEHLASASPACLKAEAQPNNATP